MIPRPAHAVWNPLAPDRERVARGGASGGLGTGRQRRQCGGFTLAEVLAALLFMAIVIPVAVQGLRIANLAGQVGARKVVAARLADNLLNEIVITRDFQKSSQNGTIREGAQEYNWLMRQEPWKQGVLRLLTVQVAFPVQGQEYTVRLSTLVDTSMP